MSQQVPLKSWFLSARLHEVISKETINLILTAVETPNFSLWNVCGVSWHA